jgi:hypothetical protein
LGGLCWGHVVATHHCGDWQGGVCAWRGVFEMVWGGGLCWEVCGAPLLATHAFALFTVKFCFKHSNAGPESAVHTCC